MTESESYDAGLAFMAKHYSEKRQIEPGRQLCPQCKTFDDDIQDIQDTGCCHICREVSIGNFL